MVVRLPGLFFTIFIENSYGLTFPACSRPTDGRAYWNSNALTSLNGGVVFKESSREGIIESGYTLGWSRGEDLRLSNVRYRDCDRLRLDALFQLKTGVALELEIISRRGERWREANGEPTFYTNPSLCYTCKFQVIAVLGINPILNQQLAYQLFLSRSFHFIPVPIALIRQ